MASAKPALCEKSCYALDRAAQVPNAHPSNGRANVIAEVVARIAGGR